MLTLILKKTPNMVHPQVYISKRELDNHQVMLPHSYTLPYSVTDSL